MTNTEARDRLMKLRNKFYDDIPVGDMNAWDLIQRIRKHVDELDSLIKLLEDGDSIKKEEH